MPTWVVIRNNRHAWAQVSVGGLQNSFASYGRILETHIFDAGSKASLLFESRADAETFVEDMTFSFHGPLFIPGLPYGSRLGAHVRQSRHRAVSFFYLFFYFFKFDLIFLGWWRRRRWTRRRWTRRRRSSRRRRSWRSSSS